MSARPVVRRAAKVRASSWNADERTIEVVWSTGAAVNRMDWDGEYAEVLSMAPGAVRLGRLNAGASLLDSHDDSGVGRVIGSTVPGSAYIADGQGHATVRLSAARDCADAVLKIVEGTVRSVSVGYWIHAQTETEANGVRTITATDWEPLEISAVAVPADGGAQFRSATPPRGRRTGLTGRAADIRRYARSAGLPRLGEKHVRAGTSADAFFAIAAQRLARRAAGTTPENHTMSKPIGSARAYERGAAEARALLKPIAPSFRGFDAYAGVGRAEPLASADDDDPDSFDEVSDDDHDDDDEEGHDDGDEGNVEDGKEAGDKLSEADRRRGAAMARGLLGRGGRGIRDAASNVQAHRREARRADESRVDDALGHEAGRREAEALLGKGRRK